jgi:hypothetical protein
MNYCLLSDAWGNDIEYFDNNIDNKDDLKNQLNNNENKIQKLEKNFSYDNNNNNNTYHNINCNDIMIHINNCKVCQQLLKNQYNIIDNLCSSVDRNRDIIILILITIFILLFFNLINNLLKN